MMTQTKSQLFLLNFVIFVLCSMAIWFVGNRYRFPDEEEKLPEKVSITENSLFIYSVYLDQRGLTPKLRVLSFNGCHNESVLFAHIGEEWKPLKPIPMYNTCPEIVAFGCLLVAYFHDMEVENNFSRSEIAIRGPSETKMVPVHVAKPAKQPGITICIAPMFWYTDWAKLIFFIEWWREQQAEEIIVYVHSTSDEVKKVLNYYEKKGWITLISWPMMPRSDNFQPNDEVYRLGQILAHNDCILRAKTELATAVDIDEIFYAKNEPILEYATKNFRNHSIGSLRFIHHNAVFESPLLPNPFNFNEVDFKGVLKMRFKKYTRRKSKVIVRTDAVERMAVHEVAAFRNNELNETAIDAAYLHIRYDTDPKYFQTDYSTTTQTNSSTIGASNSTAILDNNSTIVDSSNLQNSSDLDFSNSTMESSSFNDFSTTLNSSVVDNSPISELLNSTIDNSTIVDFQQNSTLAANATTVYYPPVILETAEIVADPIWFQLNLVGKMYTIFPNGATFHFTTQKVLGKCTDSWTETQGNCKAPVTYCRKAVENRENWVEETTNVFTVV